MPSTLAYNIEIALQAIQSAMTDPSVPGATAPTFTWKGVDYPCTPSKLIEGKLFGAGGLTLDTELTLIALESDLPTPGPQPEQFLTYDGKRYRIDTVTTQQGSVTLTCSDPARGAGIKERSM